jgi:hypothetical protein
MYVNCADSGTKAGKNTALYTDTQAQYNELKNRIVSQNKQIHLGEFCRLYVDDELMNSRKDVLDEVGYDYNEYVEKWVGADRATIESNCGLTNREKDAIITANSMKAVKLTPEMILKRERGNKRRTPLGISPVDRRNLKHTMKLITTVLTSLFTCMIGFDVIVNPSWATFAELCIKLLMIVLNGFFGYQTGYENITVHTVDYVHDQIDLLHQFEQYLILKEQAVVGQKE